MDIAIQLFAYLILSFLSFTGPIIIILLSIFRTGILKLSEQYEKEKTKSEKNIKGKLKQLGEKEITDVTEIENSLKILKNIIKYAEAKLTLLNPSKQVLRLLLPLLLAFIFIIIAILLKDNFEKGLIISVSVTLFSYAIYSFWKLLVVIVEVKTIIDDNKRNIENKTISLLQELLEEEKRQFLEYVYIMVDDKKIDGSEDGQIIISADKSQELKLGISNNENRMAKNIEIGFCFPPDFIIEKSKHYSINTTEVDQIVRYETNLIHGNTFLKLSSLKIIPLVNGEYTVKTFIKAENIRTIYRDIIFKITETLSSDVGIKQHELEK